MESSRPIVMSIAGVDPSGGAGLLADIKTFEQHKVYGLGISTAQTLQTENSFFSIRWEKESDILQSAEIMLSHYAVKAVKIGIVQSSVILEKIVSLIHNKNSMIKIVIDPVIKSSSGFNFWDENQHDKLVATLKNAYLITPNFEEACWLQSSLDAKDAAQKLSVNCNVLLKGGHNPAEPGVDYLYSNEQTIKLTTEDGTVYAKHGSGCVLSSAITANLALGYGLLKACENAKKYTHTFLSGNTTLLGYHHV